MLQTRAISTFCITRNRIWSNVAVSTKFFLLYAILLKSGIQLNAIASVTAFQSYGAVFPPLNPAIVPILDPKNATTLTLCELWENDSIPVTPGIEMALQRIRPHFALKNIQFKVLRHLIPAGCGDSSLLAVAPALVKMHLNESKGGCNLVIGPSCTETMANVRGLLMDWNITTVTSGASGIKYEDKLRTKVLTRFGYTQEDVSRVLVNVLGKYNWINTAMLYDNDSYARDFQTTFQQVLLTNNMTMSRQIEFTQIPNNLMTSKDTQWIDSILLKASERSRVFIIAAMPHVVYQILVAADRLGMTNQDYVYLTTNLIETKSHGFSDLTYFDDKARSDPMARRILDSLLVIRMKSPADDSSGRKEFEDFSNNIKTISRERYNYTYPSNEDVTHLVLGIWDAVMFYGVAVNASLYTGENILDGVNIASKIWGHSFMGIAIECTISEAGDRNFPYYLLDYNEAELAFRPALFFNNEKLKLEDVNSIHWPGDGTGPPPNMPHCGYTGNAPACQTGTIPLYGIILLAVFAVAVVAGIFGAIYRIKMGRINDDSWKIKSAEIIPRASRLPKGESSLRSLQKDTDGRTLQSMPSTKDSRLSTMSYVPTAYYRENIVAVKDLGSQVTHISTQMLFELRTLYQMQNDHITRFYGICQELETPCILMEHCAKGSLTDLIENESINLDWAFKFSLLNDISDGLIYIHNSPLKSHGRISSNNCLVDGRFILKISDLGLTSMRASTVALQKSVQSHYPEINNTLRQLLWRAPELLRVPMPPNGTPKGDIYSIGIIIQQLMQRRGPYERADSELGHSEIDVAEMIARVRDCLIPPFRPRVPFDAGPPELYSIMLRCWSEMPADRFETDKLRAQLRLIPGNKSGNLMDNLLQRMEKYARDLEELVNERTSAFMDEKKRSEELLYQMLPRPVANKLKQGLYVEPETFETVTIYFSDIVGFTTLSAVSTPMEVVDLLNDLYTLFDGVIEAYDVYKVETIGDAYVVVSGLPQRNEQRHAFEIAKMSLQVIAAIKAFKIRHKPNEQLAIRIGMHSGPCAAGVVGLKMPRYCIFGDSVNIASRLESTSEAMKIHVSIAAKTILQDSKDFALEYRGEIDLKGRGAMKTYWLHQSSDRYSSLTPSKTVLPMPTLGSAPLADVLVM
ncbi:Atrial natriuretic peptide receptor 1 [Hypsibius exemplaris]|uniref:Guanylate cyclase n=1 Tax=Hypsibius exemplaris TaxID=2072580 RepID=A0A1W0X961_HYPEX|nr:Atrial natriuretic peptide receptor 1 [Hypsibius exemplaris]